MNFSIEWLNALLGFILTLIIFSYLLGDNPLFRLAIHLFIGVSTGYIAAVSFQQVWLEQLIRPLFIVQGDPTARLWILLPLLLAILLLAKISPNLSGLGTPSIAILSGIAAALVIVGALQGTLIPQVQAGTAAFSPSNSPEFWLQGLIVLLGTIGTLAHFHFGADRALRQRGWIRFLGWIGLIFLGVTLGALFAALYSSTLTALIERLNALISFLMP